MLRNIIKEQASSNTNNPQNIVSLQRASIKSPSPAMFKSKEAFQEYLRTKVSNSTKYPPLQKVASSNNQSNAGSTLELPMTPGGLGMHSKREGAVGYRPLAYTMGVPSAAAAGISAGVLTGPFTEGRFFNILTKKGRDKIVSGAVGDYATLLKEVEPTDVLLLHASPPSLASKIAVKIMNKEALSESEQALLRNLKSIGKRRASKIGTAALGAASFAGALKTLHNIGDFEMKRALTPSGTDFQVK